MTTTIKPGRGKRFADPYEESYEDVPLDNLPVRHKAVDLTYRTHKGTRKTVRSTYMSEPSDSDRKQHGFGEDEPWWMFHGEGDGYYAYHTDERILKSLDTSILRDGQDVTLASGDDILSAKRVKYPEPAVIDGTRQDGVEATVYYRSPRSDSIVSVDVMIENDYDHDPEMQATRQSDGERLYVWPRYHRKLLKGSRSGGTFLGRVCRVEFPVGHRYTVDVRGLPDYKADEYIERIQKAVDGAYRYDDVETEVTHDGRIDRD